ELDSNQRRLSRQIYSLIPLAAREPLLNNGGDNNKVFFEVKKTTKVFRKKADKFVISKIIGWNTCKLMAF
ncbi:hypothetical protein DRB05_00475, partial [Pseudoalteromonas sp. A757]